MNERIFLIGYRGSGKSTVGPLLAGKLGWEFVDMDPEIERRVGKTIREIFNEEGEAAFRDLEQEALRELCERPRCVIATGGGAVLDLENRMLMQSHGFPVWLEADPETLWRRIEADATTAQRRPNLAGGGREEVRAMLEKRRDLYAITASFSLNADGLFPEQAADAILEAWQSFSSSLNASR